MNTLKHSTRKAQKPPGPDRPRRAAGRRRKLVLMVDDEALIRHILKLVLEDKLGVDVVEAESSEQAFRIARRRRLDLVISDYARPGMDGLTFLAQFKARYPHVPVIMLTGQAPKVRHRARRLGASAVLKKPITGPRLSRRVGLALAAATAPRD